MVKIAGGNKVGGGGEAPLVADDSQATALPAKEPGHRRRAARASLPGISDGAVQSLADRATPELPAGGPSGPRPADDEAAPAVAEGRSRRGKRTHNPEVAATSALVVATTAPVEAPDAVPAAKPTTGGRRRPATGMPGLAVTSPEGTAKLGSDPGLQGAAVGPEPSRGAAAPSGLATKRRHDRDTGPATATPSARRTSERPRADRVGRNKPPAIEAAPDGPADPVAFEAMTPSAGRTRPDRAVKPVPVAAVGVDAGSADTTVPSSAAKRRRGTRQVDAASGTEADTHRVAGKASVPPRGPRGRQARVDTEGASAALTGILPGAASLPVRGSVRQELAEAAEPKVDRRQRGRTALARGAPPGSAVSAAVGGPATASNSVSATVTSDVGVPGGESAAGSDRSVGTSQVLSPPAVSAGLPTPEVTTIPSSRRRRRRGGRRRRQRPAAGPDLQPQGDPLGSAGAPAAARPLPADGLQSEATPSTRQPPSVVLGDALASLGEPGKMSLPHTAGDRPRRRRRRRRASANGQVPAPVQAFGPALAAPSAPVADATTEGLAAAHDKPAAAVVPSKGRNGRVPGMPPEPPTFSAARLDVEALGRELGVEIEEDRWFRQALYHTSYVNERGLAGISSNERLEFLGDAVLDLAVAQYLFERYPEMPEGDLSSLRSAVVRASTLAARSRALGLGRFALLGKGEERSGGRRRPNFLADLYEALVGAIFLDQGIVAATEFVLRSLRPDLEAAAEGYEHANYKAKLQDAVQSTGSRPVSYAVVSVEGPAHSRIWQCEVRIGTRLAGLGAGRTKRSAEQEAAREALLRGWSHAEP